jgi:ABC-type multidrug transport system fused ATPase/permease subunit
MKILNYFINQPYSTDIIAHRLSTIRKADRIYVFENGRITQHGGFEELAQQKGLFAQLMARQSL